MKIYICDRGWAGCAIVIAASLEEAKKKFGSYAKYDEISEHEITNDFNHFNHGDE